MRRQRRHDFAKLLGRNRLVRRNSEAQAAAFAKTRSASGVDPVFPVVVYVSIPLTAAIGKGIAEELINDCQ